MSFKWKLAIKSCIFLRVGLLYSISVRLLFFMRFPYVVTFRSCFIPLEKEVLRDFLGSIWLGIIFSYSNALQLGASELKGITGLRMSRIY